MSGERLRAGLAMTGMSLLFGASFVGSKIALAQFTPAQLIFMRFSAAAVLFYAITPWFCGPPPDRMGRYRILLLTLFEPGAYFFLEAMGIQRTLASTAAILISTIPLFVLLLESLWLKVRVVPVEVALILLSVGGIFMLVAAGGLGQALGGSLTGNLLILLAALAASIYTVLARRLLQRYSVLVVTRLQSLYAALIYLPFAAWDWLTRESPPIRTESWLAVIYLAVGCSFVAYWLLNYSLCRVKASIVSAFTNVIPVVGTGLAVLLLHERLYPMQAIGAVVVIGCVTLLTLRRPPKEEAIPTA
jgi:drug/metabolite transporter (DMT)-like permease